MAQINDDDSQCDEEAWAMKRRAEKAETRVHELEVAIKRHYRCSNPDLAMSYDKALWRIIGLMDVD